ncbi:MAG: hypothetical protein QGI08_08670 [Paracoccaceae bacterium]|jgi:hypothetical protein|nr:hypothetical protein [Paracoccaceae bacterium]MDP7185778.1 hypothetical protein [Paracoccaceae bacterium]
MTNTLSLYLGAAILIALGVDFLLFDWFYSIFWAKKFFEFTEYIAFWR